MLIIVVLKGNGVFMDIFASSTGGSCCEIPDYDLKYLDCQVTDLEIRTTTWNYRPSFKPLSFDV